jgi:mannose-6-phosphate isomerase-like protein (cupin superfamily)
MWGQPPGSVAEAARRAVRLFVPGPIAPVGLPIVEHGDLRKLVQFSPDRVRRETIFETDRLWTEVLCFERNQSVGPITDHDSDALFTVVAGEAVFLVNGKRRRMGQWSAVLVPAGEEVSVTNASADPLVLMLVAAPPPVPRAIGG